MGSLLYYLLREYNSYKMRLLNLLLLFLTAEAKRQKRGRLKGGTKVNSATKYPSYVAFVKSSGFPFW